VIQTREVENITEVREEFARKCTANLFQTANTRHQFRKTQQQMPCANHLNVFRCEHLRAAVDEPRHVSWIIRHANANVVRVRSLHLQPQCAVPVFQRNVGWQVDVLCADDVGVLQLAHKKNLETYQL
jgi:hypothetical protein